MQTENIFTIENGVLTACDSGTDSVISIPEGVHTIANGVFKGMSWLLEVNLPSTLKIVGAEAFKGCRQIKKLVFPDGLTEVGEYAFHKCHSLNELIFPPTMKKVGSCAFLYCDNLKKVVMEGPTYLPKAVFSHNMSLCELALNEGADDSNYSDEVFEGCINLRTITLSGKTYEIDNLIQAMDLHSDYPRLIKSIAKGVFHSMQIEDGELTKFSINLKNITLPEGITVIGKSCFFDKRGIVSISLPSSLREIKANAFLNCTGLESVEFKNNDVKLDEKAFRGCCNLKNVTLGGNVYSLKEKPSNEFIGRIRDQVLGDFYISGRILLRYLGDEEQVLIPDEVEIIGERCFFGNERVKTVLCPDRLKEIGCQAFEGCLTLQNVMLPEGLKRIEKEAFAECKKLLKCNVPSSVSFIGEYAFRRCLQLKQFDPMPQNASIHPYAFYLAKDFEQPEKICRKAEPYSYFDDRNKETESEYVAPYAYTGKIDIKSLKLKGVKRIGKYAFSSCPELEEVEIDAPDCIIEQNAFSTCPKLKKIVLNVREIGKSCFSYCRNLKEVKLLGITVLPSECFAGCYQLKSFEAKSLTHMEARCFDECTHLASFDFSGIKVIGDRAFERCDALKSVTLNDIECGYHAFSDCAGLTLVELNDNTVLKDGVFIGSTQIRSVVLNGETYNFSRFVDCLNRTNNPYPIRVRETIASVWSCFDIREGKTLAGYSRDAVTVTIPDDIEEIGPDVFRDHIRLCDIKISKTVKLFGSHAFSQTEWLSNERSKNDFVIVNDVLIDGANCKGEVIIPSNVKRIAGWCFAGNTEITSLKIPYEEIAIESLSFRNCINLKKITDSAGNEYKFEKVSDLTEKEYPELILRIFSECINCFKLDGENNLIESTGNITNLIFPEGIKTISESVYKDCHLLEAITLSTDTLKIGKAAFENSKWLRSVSNASSVTSIDAQAFSGCQSLEEIDLSDELTEIGSRCFEHCVCLKDIHISNKLKLIPARAFFRCKSLTKLDVPKSVKIIEDEAFSFCENLKEVYIPAETVISENAFSYCDNVVIKRT